MERPAFTKTQRVARATPANAVGARAARRLASWAGLGMWAMASAALQPVAASAQESGGPIMIAGPNEKNPAELQAMAGKLAEGTSGSGNAANAGARANAAIAAAAAPGGALAPSMNTAPNRNSDAFARAAHTDGAIVIAGAGDSPVAQSPAMIRTSYRPDANGVVTIPPASAAVNSGYGVPATANRPARNVTPVIVAPPTQAATRGNMAVREVSVNPPAIAGQDAQAQTANGFDSLASRGEPPQFGANGKQLARPVAANIVKVSLGPSTLPGVPTATRQNLQAARNTPSAVAPAQAAQPPVPAGQQDGESIRAAALGFLQQQTAGLPGKVSLTVAPAFPRGLAACDALQPFMPTGARLWGRITVGVRCVGARPWTLYLQARVSINATYYLSARQMAPGETLSVADLVARDGDLTGLPQAIVTDPSQVIGSVTLMRVPAGVPLRQDMMRSASAVIIGQTVKVVAAGQGFSISSEGSAMNNAAPGQQVRVKTTAGQIVTGIVKDGGTVELAM
ncbi:flagellar basal body P-ring formation chaperone FlgA [Paraburkholderia sp.]|uniref:flagellar basal body P-ring formation chaperone FlgA n=1 Tax=Paraburkholderia sp. TaxID=1926495 RepID=UPI002395BC66|nr:flagellar basal body P-ring formation chaperone FlgA [Paraburkholderia sp.]MDE1181237.1 flagellar basal body P-ring formation chaperone FlgA [Paraburkholderia sp.]